MKQVFKSIKLQYSDGEMRQTKECWDHHTSFNCYLKHRVDNFKEQITVYLIMRRDFSTTAIWCKNLPSQNQRTQGHKLADMSDILLHSMSGAALKKEIKLIISK